MYIILFVGGDRVAVLGAAPSPRGEDVPVRARGGGDVPGRQRRLQPGGERQPRRTAHRVGRGARRVRAPARAAARRALPAARLRAGHRRAHRECSLLSARHRCLVH